MNLDVTKQGVTNIVVGGRHFWLSVLAGGPPFILYTYLIYHLYTLCIYTSIHIFDRPPAMSKTCLPTTMVTNLPHNIRLSYSRYWWVRFCEPTL